MTAAHDDYFTTPATPTPGDLSARLLADELDQCAKVCEVYSPDQCATLIDGIGWIAMRHKLQRAAETIRALSALPAAGGEMNGAMAVAVGTPCEKHSGENTPPLDWWLQHTNRCTVCDIEARLTTTPQPSAADDYASWAKQERQREDTATRLGSAAVGAQGDGLRNVYLRDMEDTLRQLHSIVGMDNPDVDALIEKVRRLTAPDSSVERVVDDMRKMAADRWTPYGVRQDVIAWADRLAAPAAGKGVDEPAGWNIRRRNGGLLITGPGGMSAHVDESLEQGIAGAVLHALAKELLSSTAALTRQPVAGDGKWFGPDASGGYYVKRRAEEWFYARPQTMVAPDQLAAPAATPTDGGEG